MDSSYGSGSVACYVSGDSYQMFLSFTIGSKPSCQVYVKDCSLSSPKAVLLHIFYSAVADYYQASFQAPQRHCQRHRLSGLVQKPQASIIPVEINMSGQLAEGFPDWSLVSHLAWGIRKGLFSATSGATSLFGSFWLLYFWQSRPSQPIRLAI